MNYLKKDAIFKDIIVIFFIAVIIRIIVAFWFGGFTNPEPWEYEEIAVNLFQGNGFVINFIGTDYYAYSTPLYPLICGALYQAFFHNPGLVIMFQIIISGLLSVFIYLIGLKLFGRKAGLISSALSTLHPGLIIYSALKLHALSLDAFLITLTVYCFIMLFDNFNWRWALAAGISYGLTMLTRSTIVFYPVVILAWILKCRQAEVKRIIKPALIIMIISFLLVGAWSLRNYLIFNRFIPLTTVSAEVFWRGNNINATGTSFTDAGQALREADERFYEKFKSLDELRRYDLFKQEAMNFIRQEPMKFAFLTIKKIYYFWWFSPDYGKHYPLSYAVIYKIYYALILLLALSGAIFSKNKRAILIVLALLAISFTQSFFYVEGRHRLAIEPLLMIFSAIGILRILKDESVIFNSNS